MALDPKGAKRHRPPAAPPRLFARALGAVEYVCPHCYRFQKVPSINWRRPRNRCTNRNCNRWVEFGLLCAKTAVFPSLIASRLDRNRGVSPLANHVGKVPESDPGFGQVVGPLEWWCPACAARNLAKPVPGMGYQACKACNERYFFALVLSSPVVGRHATTPTDWIPPTEEQLGILRRARRRNAAAEATARHSGATDRTEPTDPHLNGPGAGRHPGGSPGRDRGVDSDRRIHLGAGAGR